MTERLPKQQPQQLFQSHHPELTGGAESLPWREHSSPLPGTLSMCVPCSSPSAWTGVGCSDHHAAVSYSVLCTLTTGRAQMKKNSIEPQSNCHWPCVPMALRSRLSLIYASLSSTRVRVVLYFSLLAAFKKKCGPFLSFYWICYSIASTLHFGFLTERHVGF